MVQKCQGIIVVLTQKDILDLHGRHIARQGNGVDPEPGGRIGHLDGLVHHGDVNRPLFAGDLQPD